MNRVSNKFLTVYGTLVLIIPILLAYICSTVVIGMNTSSNENYVSTITKEGIKKAIDTHISTEGLEKVNNLEIHSFEIIEKNWVLAKVTHSGSASAYVLIADFKENPEPVVALGINEKYPRENISGSGVPYSVVEKLNTGWGEYEYDW